MPTDLLQLSDFFGVNPAGEFDDLTAAIEAIEAAIATPGRDGFAAAERIQDVAFTLRERRVDTTLCDALDAASSELAEAFARNDAVVERAQRALERLRELTRQPGALVAAATGAAAAVEEVPAATETPLKRHVAAEADEAEVQEVEALEDEQFAAAIGALATSFAAPTDADASADAPAGEGADAFLWEAVAEAPIERRLDEPASKNAITEESADAAPVGEASLGEKVPSEEPAKGPAPNKGGSQDESLPGATSGEGAALAVLTTAPAEQVAQQNTQQSVVASDRPLGNDTARDQNAERFDDASKASEIWSVQPLPAEEDEIESILEPPPVPRALPDSQALIGPEEDPGDLFEPLPPQSPPFAPPAEMSARGNVAVNAMLAEMVWPLAAPEASAASEKTAQETADIAPPTATNQMNAAETEAGAAAAAPVAPDKAAAELPSEWAAAAAKAVPQPASNGPRDPLAAVRALSEEELIALFS